MIKKHPPEAQVSQGYSGCLGLIAKRIGYYGLAGHYL